MVEMMDLIPLGVSSLAILIWGVVSLFLVTISPPDRGVMSLVILFFIFAISLNLLTIVLLILKNI